MCSMVVIKYDSISIRGRYTPTHSWGVYIYPKIQRLITEEWD